MAKIKKMISINNRTYKMPSWNFRDVRNLEAAGLGIMEITNPQKNIFTAISAFVAVTVGVDVDGADAIVEEYIENGGDVSELLNDYYNALGNSSFFNKWVESMSKRQQKTQPTEETEVSD